MASGQADFKRPSIGRGSFPLYCCTWPAWVSCGSDGARWRYGPPFSLVSGLYLIGAVLERVAPHLGTSGGQMVVWGFFISTVVLFHATCTINSLDHMFGTRRFDTPDTSRNNAILALITLGEGWHNSHHHYALSASQGTRWWEIDITYMLLKLMARVGIVRDLRALPERLRSG